MILSNSEMLIFKQLVKKKQANRTNYTKRSEVLKMAAGNCWWIEQFCYASIFYYNAQKRR